MPTAAQIRHANRYRDNPEYAERHRQKQRARYEKDKEYRARRNAHNSANHQSKWRNDPAYKKRCISTRFKREYGITLEEYEQMLAEQGGCCAICAEPRKTPEDMSLGVDHCHKTGAVRGILCRRCNAAVGVVDHRPEVLTNLIQYLTRNT